MASLVRSSFAAAEDAAARSARAAAKCFTCTEGNTSPAALELHNLRCAESGERSYPGVHQEQSPE